MLPPASLGPQGDIRHAVVSSALDQLADLGGSRLSMALRHVLHRKERAHTASDRLAGRGLGSRRTGSPSRYPAVADLSSLLGRTHGISNLKLTANRAPGRSQNCSPCITPPKLSRSSIGGLLVIPTGQQIFVAQIVHRSAIQQAARVPLILVFYCLVSGDQPLPRFRRELYQKVLKRMLTGRWRGRGPQPDVESCLKTLRNWAWAGASSDPISGTGTWDDDIPTGQQTMNMHDREAVGHVAAPAGLPDLDTGIVLRRFVHRSLPGAPCGGVRCWLAGNSSNDTSASPLVARS